MYKGIFYFAIGNAITNQEISENKFRNLLQKNWLENKDSISKSRIQKVKIFDMELQFGVTFKLMYLI